MKTQQQLLDELAKAREHVEEIEDVLANDDGLHDSIMTAIYEACENRGYDSAMFYGRISLTILGIADYKSELESQE